MAAGHVPAPGEAPEKTDSQNGGKPHAPAAPVPVKGKQTTPPVLPRPQASNADGSPKSQGEAATGKVSPTKDSPTAWVGPTDPDAGATEVTGARTPTTSVFQNPDGTKTMRVYSQPVHFQKPDGTWENIDTGLSRRRDNRWAEAANDQALSFSPSADGTALIDWTLDAGHRISYTLQGAKPAQATAAANTLTYPGALTDSDVEYNTLAQGIKESLVLHSTSAPTTWVFPLNTTGLSASLDTSGNVRFTDEAGKVRMTIPHGFMEDSALDPHSGEGVTSNAVTYKLTTVDGNPALQMDLDATWLKDSKRVFPVKVDPTGQINGTRSTYIVSNSATNHASENSLKTGSYNGGASYDVSYLVFDSLGSNLGNMYVQKAELDLNAIWSGGCQSRDVAVHAITSAWDPGSVNNFSQVPFDPAVLASANFQAPNSNYCPGSPVTVPFNLGSDPTTAGVQLVNSWTHGGGNYGFALTSDNSDIQAWKQFDSVNTQHPPFLKLTYVDWAADYSIPGDYIQPTAVTPGSQQVTMTNIAANWWNSNSMRVKPRFYDASWHEFWPGAGTTTGVPGLVKTGDTVTFTATIPPMAPGTSYQLCWDGLVNGTYSLRDDFGILYHTCTWVSAKNVDPQIDTMVPLSNSVVGTLSPQLYASGHDPDNYPGTGVDYNFRVYTNPSSGDPQLLAESGWQPSQTWSVPAGKLAWNSSYQWTVMAGDHIGASPWSGYATFSTQLQQPVITSHLGGAASDGAGHDFDAHVGNYTTAATDASVKTVGPALTVTRSYNSLDPRTSTLFGAGWTSAFDMQVQPDQDGTGAVVLTTANGRTGRFGLGGSGTVYTPPPGEFASLTKVDAGFDLTAKDGVVYQFHIPSGSAYALSRVTDAAGHIQDLTYTNSKLSTVKDNASGRALHFEWTTDNRHVAKVNTDPATGTDWNTAQTWTYTYDSGNPDQLNGVCTPPAGTNTTRPCTGYTYDPGSHLRSAVLDSAPVSYWRLGEASGSTAASEVIENQGNDNATYSAQGVTLGTPGPAAAATAATFDGSSGYVTLPQTGLSNSSYTSVGLWFKTTGSGVLFSYQTENFPGSGTTAGDYTPALYVGTSGKLHGKFWAGSSNPMQSSKAVNDGQWHFAVLSAAGVTQTLYLDGQAQDTLAGPVLAPGQRAGAIGGGFTSAWWQDSPFSDFTGRASYFTGSISDVAFYNRTLGAPTVQALWQAGSQRSTELSSVKLPSGKTQLTVAYDTSKDRAFQITDENRGTWKLDNPTVSGSSQAYRGQVMGSQPAGYWRLSESQGVQAANQVYTPRPTPNNGNYANVSLGAPGPMKGSAGSATFDGSTSWAELPAAYAPQNGPGALALWFRTDRAGVLLSYQSFPVNGSPNGTTDRWNPALYVDSGGKLRAQLWMGDAAPTLASSTPVNDNKWHFAVISADSQSSQTLYLDGAAAAGPLNGTITPNGTSHVFLGAGNVTGGWPQAPADRAGHFKGQLADVAAYPHGLSAATISSLYQLATTADATQYAAAVVDAHPTGYWRLGDTTGNQATEVVSSAALAQNRGSYHNTTCCQNGPWASGTSTATGFNGTTSYVQLSANTAPKPYSGTAVELWFKTTAPGVLYSHQSFPIDGKPNGSTDRWNPALYIGSDKKLYGALWTGSANNALVSTTTVTDGKWHHVALTGDSNGQTLYLDGAPNATSTTALPITYNGSAYDYLGAGWTGGGWPNPPSDQVGYFNGAIADFSIYSYPLVAGAVADHYRAATTPGTGGLDAAGAYRAAVVQAGPIQYWRLNDPSGSSYAAAELGTAMPDLTAGTYNDVTLNANGPSNDYGNQRAAVFNGTTSQIQLPSSAAPTHGPATMELWFNTTSGGPLYSYQDFPVGSPLGNSWNPALYVGSDGRVHGEFWMGSGAVMTSDRTVNDGNWHQVVLAADDSGQTIYIDGQPSASDTTGRKITFNGTPYVYLGAGTTTGWGWPAGGADHFTGNIAEASYYTSRLDAATVAAHFKAMGEGGTATPVTTAHVIDPTGNTLAYLYDSRSAKLIARSDAWGHTTRYTYDTNGYLHTVTDADGHTVTTGHDDRGNALSRTTCQDTTHCNTSYAHYYLDGTADHLGAVNDTVTDRSDARSNGPGDATYRTQYSYDPAGELLSTTVPATADFPQGRASYVARTSGTEAAVGSDGKPTTGTQPPGLVTSQSPYVDHAAYPNQAAVPANLSTVNSYNAAGDLTKTVTPLGLTTTYTYNNLGRLTSTTETCTNCGPGQTPSTSTTSYGWDGQGNPLTRTDPATTDAVTGTVHTRQTTTAYDTDGNPLTQTVADLTGGDTPRTTTWAYSGTTSQLTKVTDPAGRSTSYTYDKYGNKVTSTDAAGTTYNYDYAPMGWLQQVAVTNYTGSPTSPVSARWQILESRAYDPAGRLAKVTDAMGRSTHTYYNDDNTVAEIDADAFHNFDPVAKTFDGTLRNVVLQQNTYDAAGHLTQRVTGGGKTTVANTWDAAGRATSTTVDPGGVNRTSSNTYDAADHVLRSTIADGTQTRESDFTYDVAGNVTAQTVKNPPQDSTTSFSYDQRGLPLTRTSPNGNVSGANPASYTVSYSYDAAGQQTAITEPPVSTTTLDRATGQPLTLTVAPETRTGYNTFGESTETKDPTGGITTTTHTFDATGEHLAVASNTYTAPDGSGTFTAVTRTDFDATGRPKALTDAKGNTATNTYDQLGNLVEKDLPSVGGATRKWLYSYDLDGEKQSVTDPAGAQTLSTYDDLGRTVTLTDLVRTANQPTASYTSAFGYDDAGNRTTAVSPTGAAAAFGYDAAGERTSTTDSLQRTTRTGYDLTGQVVKVTLPGTGPGVDGPATTTSYDQAGNHTATTQLSATGTTLATSSATFDAAGEQLSITDPDGNTTTAVYDGLGRQVQQTQPVAAGHSITTAFAYDAAGRRTGYTDGNGNTTYSTFNSLGLPESTIEPATSAYPNPADRTYTTSYDPLGEAVSLKEPGGVTISSSYDTAGHLTSQAGSGGEAPTPTRTFGYDADGRITSLSTPRGTQSYTYEDRGAIASASGPMGTGSYTYDAEGRLASRADAAGTTTFTYDSAGQLKTLTDPQTGSTLAYSYTPTGRVATIQYGTGNTRSYTYDDQGNVTTDSVKTSTGAAVSSLGYTYYPSGHLKTQTTTGLAGATTHTYGYDAAGRLSTWNNGTATTAYAYDGNGNLTSNGTTTATYNQRNQLSSAGATNYTYTARGTRSAATTGTTTTSATYDAFDELTAQGGQTYAYDALGRLTTSAGHTFSYDATSNNLTSDGTENYTRTPSGGLTAIGNSAGSAFAYSDRHGNLVGTFTATGTATVGSRAYDPWGKPTATAGTTHDLGYQGGWTDPTSGQVSTASRWYDPATADFTSRDTANLAPVTAAGANRYTYGAGDPLTNADPSGHNPCVPGDGGGGGDDPGGDPDNPAGDGAGAASAPAYAGMSASAWERKAQHMADMEIAEAAERKASYDRMSYGESSANQQYAGGYWSTISTAAATGWIWTGAGGGAAHAGAEQAAGELRAGGNSAGATIYQLARAQGLAAIAAEEAEIEADEDLMAAGRSGCDTDGPVGPPPHRHHHAPTPPERIDPHNVDPILCRVCSTPTPQGALPNGPENGLTQQGIPDTFGNQSAQAPFSPGSAGQAPGSPTTGNQIDQNCSKGSGVGYQLPLGLDDSSRSNGMMACVTKSSVRSSGTSPVSEKARADLSGYAEAQEYVDKTMGLVPEKTINACHLIADTLGGSGTDQRNLATCFRGVNTFDRSAGSLGRNNMAVMEREVKQAALGGQSVLYVVIPKYRSDASKVPYKFVLSARGYYANGAAGINRDMDVDNTYGVGGVNLGDVIK
ncbi:LamG-like jellyroll fold domain-containing protein [Kitasatospora sp. NPDC127059]|uniref:LamG-like jellyroll fold domain-containing protein n=1 Tax=Kitasatospora sp. NPDC127059 TaxID=3347120 RepID=UPI0036462B34